MTSFGKEIQENVTKVVHVTRENHRAALEKIREKMKSLPETVIEMSVTMMNGREIIEVRPGVASLITSTSTSEIKLKKETVIACLESKAAANHFKARESLNALASGVRTASSAILAAFFPVSELQDFLIPWDTVRSLVNKGEPLPDGSDRPRQVFFLKKKSLCPFCPWSNKHRNTEIVWKKKQKTSRGVGTRDFVFRKFRRFWLRFVR